MDRDTGAIARLADADLAAHLQGADLALQGLLQLLMAAPPETMLRADQVQALLAPIADDVMQARQAVI